MTAITEKEKEQIILVSDSEDKENDDIKKGFFVLNSKYYTAEKNSKGEYNEIELSNFIGKSIFNLIDGTNNSKRIIQLQRYSGEIHTVEIQSSDMTPTTFETILKSKRCTFFGSAYKLKKIFAAWMEEEKTANIIDVMGWNNKFQLFAFSNGAYFPEKNKLYLVNENGIICEEERKINYFFPAYSFANIDNPLYDNERKFKYLEGGLNFERFAELYFKAFGWNGAIGLSFAILALFWDLIFDQIGFFPFLFLFGPFGTGKTSFIEPLLSLFGTDTIGNSLNNSSTIGLTRVLASRNNALLYLKEYTADTDKSNQDLLLSAYDGAGRTIGIKSNDNRTQVSNIKSALLIDGNELPVQKSAVLSRMILLNFEGNKFNNTQITNFNILKKEQERGLGKVLIEVLSKRKKFQENFKEIFNKNISDLKEQQLDFSARTFNHVALILTPYLLLYDEFQFPFKFNDLYQNIIDVSIDQENLLKETNDISIFWQAFAYNVKKNNLIRFDDSTGYSSNKEFAHYNYKFKEKVENKGLHILQIKYSVVYPEYVKYVKSNNQRLLDQSSLRKLLTSKTYKHFIPSSNEKKTASTDKKFGSCFEFILEKTNEGLFIDNIELDLK